VTHFGTMMCDTILTKVFLGTNLTDVIVTVMRTKSCICIKQST